MAAGNPKHIEELVDQLKKHKAIHVDSHGRISLLALSFDNVHSCRSPPPPPRLLG